MWKWNQKCGILAMMNNGTDGQFLILWGITIALLTIRSGFFRLKPYLLNVFLILTWLIKFFSGRYSDSNYTLDTFLWSCLCLNLIVASKLRNSSSRLLVTVTSTLYIFLSSRRWLLHNLSYFHHTCGRHLYLLLFVGLTREPLQVLNRFWLEIKAIRETLLRCAQIHKGSGAWISGVRYWVFF
jgi:hypothetical protein